MGWERDWGGGPEDPGGVSPIHAALLLTAFSCRPDSG